MLSRQTVLALLVAAALVVAAFASAGLGTQSAGLGTQSAGLGTQSAGLGTARAGFETESTLQAAEVNAETASAAAELETERTAPGAEGPREPVTPLSQPTQGNPGSLAFHMERIFGPDRYSAAAAASAHFFASAQTVFVTSGEVFADTAAAGPAAHGLNAPVLLVRAGSIPPETGAEINRLAPQRIFVVGGPDTVSGSVLSQLNAMAPEGATRVAGADRYLTAAAVSQAFFTTPATVDVVHVVTGVRFPDAMTAGVPAALSGGPTLLTRVESLPAETAAQIERLAPSRIVIAGGPDSVSPAVEATLSQLAPTSRIGGFDRYEASANISAASFPQGSGTAIVVTGVRFPDALAAVSPAASLNAPILLSRTENLPPAVTAELNRLGPQQVLVVGGPESVSNEVMRGIQRGFGVCVAAAKPPIGQQQVFDTIPGAIGQVALTFDMGGRMEPAVSIMDFLVAEQVCSTIFPTGVMSQTDEGAAVLDIIARHPHLFEVGNHTMWHCNFRDGGGGSPTTDPCPTTPPSDAFIRASLTDAEAVIAAGAWQTTVPFWRPPYGAFDQRVLNAAASVGLTKTFMWDIDTIDWLHPADGGPSAEEMAAQVVGEAVSGSNVLMHLGGWNTRDALPAMVAGLRDRGFTLTTLSEMVE